MRFQSMCLSICASLNLIFLCLPFYFRLVRLLNNYTDDVSLADKENVTIPSPNFQLFVVNVSKTSSNVTYVPSVVVGNVTQQVPVILFSSLSLSLCLSLCLSPSLPLSLLPPLPLSPLSPSLPPLSLSPLSLSSPFYPSLSLSLPPSPLSSPLSLSLSLTLSPLSLFLAVPAHTCVCVCLCV